jgi:hypothetical protein
MPNFHLKRGISVSQNGDIKSNPTTSGRRPFVGFIIKSNLKMQKEANPFQGIY